jgi:hypothetical protein
VGRAFSPVGFKPASTTVDAINKNGMRRANLWWRAYHRMASQSD